MAEVIKKEVPIVAPGYRIPRDTGTPTTYKGNQTLRYVMGTFNPSANSGERTVAAHGLGVYVPINAVITRAWIDVVTTFADGASDAATIAIHLQSAGDIVAAIAISDATNVWDAGAHGSKIGTYALDGNALSQVAGGAALSATFIKMTAERELTATVAVHALTAGKANIFVEYFISD